MKYALRATISVGNYSNLQPEITVEADTFEEAQAQVMPHIEQVWEQYGEKPLNSKTLEIGGNRKLIKGLVGGEIYRDDSTHIYTNKAGEVYLSGSRHAATFEKPFDAKMISRIMAKNVDFSAQDILEMWALKSQVSNDFGHALHGALELHGKYLRLSHALDAHRATKDQDPKHTHLHDNLILKPAVESFYKGRENEIAEYEPVVIDHTNKRVGQIDRLLITGDKECTVQDYKTNNEMTEDKLKVYFEQLKFYGEILEVHGWKVNPPEIYHYDGIWHEFKETKV